MLRCNILKCNICSAHPATSQEHRGRVWSSEEEKCTRAMPCSAVPGYSMLRYAVLGYATLCCAMLCYAMLGYAVL